MMNNQQKIWDKVYLEKKLMTGNKPQKSFLHFIKFLKKEWKKQNRSNEFGESALKYKTFLDLGSGEGKNSIYVAKSGGNVDSIEISKVALKNFENILKKDDELILKEIQVAGGKININYGSIASDYIKKFSFKKESFDVVFDITSSNALIPKEREEYLKNVNNVLKNDGYFFVRVPAKDENAKKMILKYSANKITGDKNSYIIPDIGLIETVFTEESFRKIYEKYFKIIKIQKEKHYLKINDKIYKKFYIVAYMKKK